MKNALLITALCLSGCKSNKSGQSTAQPVRQRDTIVKHDTVYLSNGDRDWQAGFGLTHDPEKDSIWGKPVQHYLNEPGCSEMALDFYYGQTRPTDNGATSELLKLACTDNKKLRPFYRWCLNKTILIQDGALAEYTGVPARRYAEKFPKEFFEYMDSDTSSGKYKDWVGSILYSGFYDTDDYKKPAVIRKNFLNRMKENCKGCNGILQKRMQQLATDCFSKEIE